MWYDRYIGGQALAHGGHAMDLAALSAREEQ
jgi:hypothetical protein